MEAASRSEFAARLVEFNLHMARFAHRSWFPSALQRAVPEAVARCDDRSERALSHWLSVQLHLGGRMDWSMREPGCRLFLLDRGSLARLCVDLSLAMHRFALARVIDGTRVRDLLTVVDPEAWRFAVGRLPGEAARHDGSTIAFDDIEPTALPSALEHDGAGLLLSMIPSTSTAVRERARLRFDRSLVPARVDEAGRVRLLDLVCTHLIPGRFPQWAWLF